MKDIIVRCNNTDEIKAICYNVPINDTDLGYTPYQLIRRITENFGEKVSFRIEDGTIDGYNYHDGYCNPRYKHFNYSNFVSSELPCIETLDYNNTTLHVKTKKEAEELVNLYPSTRYNISSDWIDLWDVYSENTVYVIDNGSIRYYGKAYSPSNPNPYEFAEHKKRITAFEMANGTHYIQIKTKKQFEWMQNNIRNMPRFAWNEYRSKTVIKISSMKFDGIGNASRLLGITYTPFKEVKNAIEVYKAQLCNDEATTVLYVHCSTPIEVRHVCKNYPSFFTPFSAKNWIKCFNKYGRNTVYKILNGKIVGALNKNWISNLVVKEFSDIFPNAEESSDFRACDHCGEVDNNPESSFFIDINGNVISMNHAHNYKQCALCGGFEYVDNMTLCDGSEVCSNCIETETAICDACGEHHLRHNTRTDNRNVTLCNQCRTDFIMCESCGNFTPIADATEYNNDYYCSGCLETAKRNHAICNYYYKPKPIFYGDEARYFGVELEVDGAGEDTANAYKILCAANSDNEYIYIKHDGSLEDGFEIVSHPMTLNYHHHNMDWKTVMDIAIGQGYFSHNTNSCGLHVHVNRTSLGATESEQEETIAKILFFVELHWNEIVKFTRRSEYAINRWAARYGFETEAKKILNKAKEYGRYSAVNLNNEHTIEFRIFRGTLKYNTFIATLQFVNRICELALTSTESEIESTSWLDFISNVNEPELIQYLKERKLYINEDVNTEEEI